MAQADPDFDWTTAQPVEEDETSATLTATTFGQRSMPAPTQGPVNIDTEFDWKTATLDEPFDPATAQPISEQEEQQFYQDLEVASRDPQRILTNTEHSLLYDHRQQQDDAVARFFQGAEDVPGNLLSLGMDAGTELRENWFENMFRPDRFAARNLATGMEIGRKAGVQLLQLLNWGQNKVADTIQRGNANDAKMREIAAAVPKTGDERVDGDNVMAAIAKARDEGVFEETPFGPDKEQDYERYLRQNSYARSHAGNITEATMGGKTMTFPNEQTTVLGQQPMQAVSTIGAMGLDITNALPMGAGIFSKLRVLRRLSRVTGMPLPAVERGLAGVADGMEDFGSRVAARVTDKTGLSKTQQVASLAAVSGGAGLLAANTDGMDGVLLPVAAVSGIVPAYKLVGGTIRKTSQAAGTSAMVLREMRAGNIGVVRQAAADDLLRTGTVPPQYAAYMRPYANGVESTLGRVAKNPDNPEITRKLARLADGSGVTQAVRFADDAVSSGIAATLASTPFALLAPDAEQAGAIVGGAATLGTFAGPFAGAFGRSSSRKDADIARMLIDVHAVNGDVPALISLGRDRLGQIAGMQGVVAGKTDFVTLRASDYRANVDVRATGNETGAGVFIEKASNGTARIFINVGEPASMDGKVRVRDRGDGVREVRVRGNDGRTEFIAAPKGRRLLVNDGDTVKAGQQVVDYMPPSRSMPHEIAHAILTSDILDGDIRTDMRNYVTQVYGEDGIKARGREYMAQIVDGDIMFGTHEGAVALTPEEVADVRSGKRTMSDVMKGKPVEAAERDALINARIDEYNQRSREKGGNDYDWARDEVVAEQFAGEAKGIDFRGIRAGGPKVLESALATSARVLEVLGAKFDRTTGKPLDNPSVLFRDNPLFQSPVLRKRMIEHVRAYNDLLAGLEDAGKRETRGTKVSVDGTPDSAARSPHTKMRPDPDKGGQVGNEFLYVDETGKTQWRSPSEVRAREGSRTSQANTMYNPSRILAPNSTEFGRRTTDSGRTIVSGPTLPAQFDHFVHFPKWMREFARVLEASRERGMTFIADYNAIGDGKDGVYRVRNRGDIRAIQREVAFVGWELTGNKHLKTVLMDLNAFRASAMKAINNGELGIFNNDMQVIEADLRTYLGNHRNGLPGEAGIGQAKRDMLNGLIGTGTAVQRKANPLFSDLNPRGSVRSFRLDRYNDLTPTGREGLSFDYDKINNNRMPQQIPRDAQGMPDAVDALTTDQLLRQYEENQGYLGLSTLGMREGRPVRGGAAQTRELLRRNEAISAELERRGVRSEDAQLRRALQRRGQAMPDAQPAGAAETLDQLKRSQFIPTRVAAEVVGGFPEYLRPVAQFITDQRQKLASGQMTRRDVMKAYVMTVASQGSGARAVEVIANNVAKDGIKFRPSKDFTTADKQGRAAIRPEEAAAYWLGTDAGQRALNNFEAGRYNPEDWKELVAIRKAYGDDRFKNLGAFNPENIRTMDKVLADLNASRADTGKVMDAVQQLRGIKTGKKGFIAHLLGIGDVPTIDAVEINFWLTGKADIGKLNTRRATLARNIKNSISDKRVSQEMFRRIDQRINALRDEVPGGAEITPEVWSHVMHHWLWDKSKGIETTHEGMYRAQAQFMPDAVVGDEGGPVWRTLQDAPVITLKDLKGRKVFAAFADLTSAGKIYRGIDSSEIAVPIETHGGPEWPLLQAEKVGEETNVWSNQGAGVSAIKARRANEGAIMLIAAMDKNAHVSNTETATAVIATNAAYARDGRITPENLATLDNLVRAEIEDFPGIESPNIMEYVNKLPFQGAKSRARIAEILESKKSQDLGAANVQRILDEMRSDQYDGLRIGDAVLAIELTPGAPAVKLGEQGTLKHPSYQYALRGRVIGRFARPINISSIFDDFYAKRRAEGKPELGDRRAFDLAKPVQEITDTIASRIPGTPYMSFKSPRHAQLINMAKDGKWRSTEQTVRAGGVSPAAFIDALNASPAKLALDRYTLKGLQEKLETRAMSIYQLGDAQVFFGIKQGDPASAYGQNPAAFGFGPNEKTLSLVLNNERRTGGMADAIVVKALQEGVTALDCFAVKSEKYPNGMLPSLYEAYGFQSTGSLPFDPQFYSKTELADLKKYWKSIGWDERLGLPEIVLMKWRGNNELRTKSLRELAEQGGQSFRGEARPIVRDARSRSKSTSNKRNQSKRRARQGDAGAGAGSQGDAGGGVRLSGGFLRAYDELLSLSPDELRNLGIQ